MEINEKEISLILFKSSRLGDNFGGYTQWLVDYGEYKFRDKELGEKTTALRKLIWCNLSVERLDEFYVAHRKLREYLEPYNKLKEALQNPIWLDHKIGDEYTMDGKPALWKIAYYPILDDGKTGEVYEEPRALVEKPIQGGIDFREIPLRYLKKHIVNEKGSNC